MTPIESVTITDQNTQSSLGGRGWNLNRNLPHNTLTAIWPQDSFYRDFVSRPGLSEVRARCFKARRTPLGDEIEIQAYCIDLRRPVRIIKDTIKVISQRHGNLIRGWHSLDGCKHIAQLH